MTHYTLPKYIAKFFWTIAQLLSRRSFLHEGVLDLKVPTYQVDLLFPQRLA
jgi:hypothetical protein